MYKTIQHKYLTIHPSRSCCTWAFVDTGWWHSTGRTTAGWGSVRRRRQYWCQLWPIACLCRSSRWSRRNSRDSGYCLSRWASWGTACPLVSHRRIYSTPLGSLCSCALSIWLHGQSPCNCPLHSSASVIIDNYGLKCMQRMQDQTHCPPIYLFHDPVPH